MQANEVLGKFDLALSDCKEVIKLDPKNVDAIRANQRLSQRIEGKSECFALHAQHWRFKVSFFAHSRLISGIIQRERIIVVATWFVCEGCVIHTETAAFTVEGNVHFSSHEWFPNQNSSKFQKPLRRIQINEPLPTTNSTPPDKKAKDSENEAFKIVAGQMSNTSADKIVAAVPTNPPNSSAQFYRAWRELVDDRQKYSYLKVRFVFPEAMICWLRLKVSFVLVLQIIKETTFNKLLGPQFNNEMLKDLLKILSESFVRDNLPVGGILKQIIVNDEFKILKMLMDTEDRNGKNCQSVWVNGLGN